MNTLEVTTRLNELQKGVEAAKRILEIPVEGRLEIFKKGNQYFYCKVSPVQMTGNAAVIHTESGENLRKNRKTYERTYLRKADRNQVQQIAQRDYAKQFLDYAEFEIALLEQLQELYSGTHAFVLHENLHPARESMSKPILLSDAEYAKAWLDKRSKMENPYPNISQIYTEKQEHVRSKTEKIIADKLNLLGVPYKYEEPLKLKNGIVFPDFTVLNIRTRKVYYWEHFGCIDYEDYRNKMMKKTEEYNRNHIVCGDNLIITFETQMNALSTATIENIIKQNFLL